MFLLRVSGVSAEGAEGTVGRPWFEFLMLFCGGWPAFQVFAVWGSRFYRVRILILCKRSTFFSKFYDTDFAWSVIPAAGAGAMLPAGIHVSSGGPWIQENKRYLRTCAGNRRVLYSVQLYLYKLSLIAFFLLFQRFRYSPHPFVNLPLVL